MKPLVTISLVLNLGLITGLSLNLVHANTLPVCAHAASDYDGDGYGWENNQSCEVTNESAGKPTIVNLLTGTEVDLVRPYWNAYRDFEDRDIRCDYYRYSQCTYAPYPGECLGSGSDRVITPGDDYAKNGHFVFDVRGNQSWPVAQQTTHNGLPSASPWNGFQQQYYERRDDGSNRNGLYTLETRLQDWTVNDGIYYASDGWLSEARYVELSEDHNGSVRHWISDTNYYQCYDIHGARFQPTGNQGEARPVPVVVADDFYMVSGDEDNAGIVTIPEVQLDRVYWDMSKLYDREVSCSVNEGGDSADVDYLSASYVMYAPPHDDPANSHYIYNPGYFHFATALSMKIESGQVLGAPRFLQAQYVEITATNDESSAITGIRVWKDNEHSEDCEMSDGGTMPVFTGTMLDAMSATTTVDSDDNSDATTSDANTENNNAPVDTDNSTDTLSSNDASEETRDQTPGGGGGSIGIWLLLLLSAVSRISPKNQCKKRITTNRLQYHGR